MGATIADMPEQVWGEASHWQAQCGFPMITGKFVLNSVSLQSDSNCSFVNGFVRYSGDFTDGLGPLQSKIGQSNSGYVPYVDYAHDYNMPLHVNTNGQLPNGNMSLTRHRELRQDNGLPNIGSGMGSLSNSLMSK